MASRPISLTTHAIERFRDRIVPHLSLTEAEALLAERAESAAPVRRRSILGSEQWRITEPDAILVVIRDRRQLVCRTVLDPHDPRTAEGEPPIVRNVDPWEEEP